MKSRLNDVNRQLKRLILFILLPTTFLSCKTQKNIIKENITIKIYPYEVDNEIKASAMPELNQSSDLVKFKRRFEYLIINIPEFHSVQMFEERIRLFNLYPDTVKMKELILEMYLNDEKFSSYFEQTYKAIKKPELKNKISFTSDELMEVASKFFLCDKVNPDTTIQSRVCVGLNGVSELNLEKDVTLLAAFCYEAIFNGLSKDKSKISEEWDIEKENATEHFRRNITSLESYLEDVKQELYKRMKSNASLKQELFTYYELNKNNLAFRITQ
ncbi:MAG: hypothetical protein ACK4K0_07850 [Flavobacteriales bacterium]